VVSPHADRQRPGWRRYTGWTVLGLALSGVVGYFALLTVLGLEAHERLLHGPDGVADTALVLGSRAYLNGRPSPCLTGRVDAGLALAAAGSVGTLTLSGGRDIKDGRIEAQVMAQHARASGYVGKLVLESQSSSTRENLAFSRPLLISAGVRSVVIVSEPYHLWRVRHLVEASGFDRGLQVQYAAAATSCWHHRGMDFKGAWREPFAVVHNFLHGYFSADPQA